MAQRGSSSWWSTIGAASAVARSAPVGLLLLVLASLSPSRSLLAQTDLDVLMQRVLSTRDDNWRKLQQYVLDEREEVQLDGPSRTSIWGERREYTWYIRDGFFVRSPVKVNGASISESDRRKNEAEHLRRSQQREARAGESDASSQP